MQTNSPFKRILLAPLVTLGVILMLVEEHLWDALVAFGIWLGRLPLLYRVETGLRSLPPKWAAVALFLPVALIFPVKVLAVWVMSTGRWGLGLTVLLTAKLVGTAMVARIYTLCEPALSQLPWFLRLRGMFLRAKHWAHVRLEGWVLWRQVRRWGHRAKAAVIAAWRVALKRG